VGKPRDWDFKVGSTVEETTFDLDM